MEKKRLMTMMLAVLCSAVQAWAIALIDGFYYQLNTGEKTALVTCKNDPYGNNNFNSHYVGNKEIPEVITYKDVEYSVTGIKKSAFAGCKDLTSITIPKSITTIGDRAFDDCIGLTSIVIPESVTSMGQYVFLGCSGLTSISLPNDIEVIDQATFQGCSGIKTIALPKGLASIGQAAFYGCTHLEALTIPDGVATIGNSTFKGCTALMSIHLPSSLQTLGESTFENCENIESIELPNGLTAIESCAFRDCHKLKSINIPNKVTSIGGLAFSGCTLLQSVQLLDGIVAIEGSAFNGCSSLTEITIPATATNISNAAFANCTGLETIKIYTPVVDSWFAGLTSIKTLVLGEGVTSVIWLNNGAFSGCTGLENVTLPTTLEKVADYMFKGCTSLRRIEIPEGVTVVGRSSFSGCTALTNLSLPSTLTEIGQYAFSGCDIKDVGTLNMPTIKNWFQRLTSLENVKFGENVTTIEASAFSGCTSLQSIMLPANISSIGSSAFSGCTNLTHIYSQIQKPFAVPGGFGAFPWNNAVLIVPKGTRSDYQSVTGWKDAVIFEEGETIYNKVVTDEQGIVYTLNQTDNQCYYSVTGHTDSLPSEITLAGDIDGCPVTTLAGSAFRDCTNLTRVTLSAGLTSVSFSAFEGCISLKEIVSLIQDPAKANIRTSQEVSNRAILRVPVGTKAAYLGISSWKSFFVYEEGEEVNDYERTITDEQGVTYTLAQNEEGFYYSVTGHTDALTERVTLPEQIDGIPVTSMESYAFKGCTGLKYISIPETLNHRNWGYNSAFEGCSLALALNQEVVEKWANSAFITELELGSKVDSLASSAFSGCTNLSKVTFSEGIRVLESSCFSGCTSLQTVTLPSGIVKMGNSVFYGCTALTSVTFKGSMESIGSSMFSGCTSLESVVLPAGLTSIGASAFSGCSSLVDFQFPETLTSIGSSAFYSCTGLTEVTVPATISGWDNPFSGCTSVAKVTWEALTYSNWFPSVKELYIGKDVNKINDGATSGCANLESVIVDEANTVYDSREGCNAIITTATNKLVAGCKNTVIPDGLTSIAMNAFQGQSGLEAITIPATVSSIGYHAFYGCTGLQHVTSYIQKPGSISAFDSETLATATLTVPFGQTNSYKKTSGWNFQKIEEMEGNEEEMTFIEFADPNVKQICVSLGKWGDTWDENGDGEISLAEAKQVTTLYSSYFSGSSSIVSFDEFKYFTNITNIPDNAFSNCKSLTSITLPNSVRTFGQRAFSGCENLTTINLPEGISVINDYVFSGCKSLQTMSLPSTVTSIGQYAFQNCANLTSIELPEGLTSIGTRAFSGCGFKEMTLPATLTAIGDYALVGNTIYCLFSTPFNVNYPIGNPSDVLLYVPQGSERLFSEAEGWKNFLVMGLGAEKTDWTKGQITVDVEEAGGLRLSLVELDEEEITRLKIRGSLNSVDIKYLIESPGKIANLESLDLSDVTLIYDGGCYREGSAGGIGEEGFYNSYSSYYLTEEEYARHSHSVFGGPSGTDYFYYYSPNLLGVFEGKGYKHVMMPRIIKKAAKDVFRRCQNLQCVDFPGGLTCIDALAFFQCERLDSINLEFVDSIYADAFYGCKMLQKVEHIENVKYIGPSAFANCSRFSGSHGILSLPNVSSISSSAFENCYNLNNILFSDNLLSIGSSAFAGCKTLEDIALPKNLTTIGNWAFLDCKMLKQVSYHKSLKHVNYTSFQNTPWMNALPSENGILYMGTIALSYDRNSDVAAAKPATLTFREGTTAIADRLLESLNFEINNRSYYYQENVTALSLPSTLRAIGREAFKGNQFAAIVLPEGLEAIGDEAFSKSLQLAKVTLHENLKDVGQSAFAWSGMSLVNYNSIEANGSAVFAGCSSLEKVNVGAQVRKLPNRCFDGAKNLAVVKCAEHSDGIPLAIGDSAFWQCGNLASLSLPQSATNEIGSASFAGCTSLTSFTIPEKVCIIPEQAFSGCSALTSVKMHDNITIIGDEAFSGCNSLLTLDLPIGLDSIGSGAFSQCHSFTELIIPSSVTRLGNNFLGDCYNLSVLHSNIAQPDDIEDVLSMSDGCIRQFLGISWPDPSYHDILYDVVTLIVPNGSKPLYQAAEGWKKFQIIKEKSGNDITATNKLSANGLMMVAGETAELRILLQNDVTDFSAYQFDIILPLGFRPVEDGNGAYQAMAGERYEAGDFTISIREQPVPLYSSYSKYRVVCLSLDNSVITGTDGPLLIIPLNSNSQKAVGSYTGKLENIIFTQTDDTMTQLDNSEFTLIIREPGVLSGDANNDGEVNVADAVEMINYILGTPSEDFSYEASDLNKDGEVDVFDVTKVINIILSFRKTATDKALSKIQGIACRDLLLYANDNCISIDVNHDEHYTAFQMDVDVPDGVELVEVVPCDWLNNHVVRFAKKSESRYSVVVLSMTNEELRSGYEGLLSLRFSSLQNSELHFKNIMFVSSEGRISTFSNKTLNMATGISSVSETSSEVIYDLKGKKQSDKREKLHRGIYIVNNKKLFIK